MIDDNPVPNNELPIGAKAIKVKTLKLGGWREMKFDAKLIYRGITWYRCYRGMGGENRREDWCADVPCPGIAVHDYHWNGEEFGLSYGSMKAAMDGELVRGLETVKRRIKETEASLAILEKGRELLESLFG